MADTKVSGLTADTAPQPTDLLYTVDDPGGTPVSKKATIQDVLGAVPRQTIFTIAGAVFTGANPIRIYNNSGVTLTISEVFLAANTAPTDAALIVDIHKDGTTIFTTQSNRPQIAASANTGNTTTIEVPSWADGEYLTMEVDQIGSTVAGSDLTVHIIHN